MEQIEKIIIAIDPSTTETGLVLFKNEKNVNEDLIDAKGLIYNAKGKLLKRRGAFDPEIFANKLELIFLKIKKQYNYKDVDFYVMLPKMSGALNYNTIDKLSRLSGIVHGIASTMNFNVLYVNENSARSRVLKNRRGESYKEKAMELSGYDNDNLADAYVLGKAFIDYYDSERELFKEF
jgi:hypothetical protein